MAHKYGPIPTFGHLAKNNFERLVAKIQETRSQSEPTEGYSKHSPDEPFVRFKRCRK